MFEVAGIRYRYDGSYEDATDTRLDHIGSGFEGVTVQLKLKE